MLLIVLAKPLFNSTLEIIHVLNHGKVAHHTLASHTKFSKKITHNHYFLVVAKKALCENKYVNPKNIPTTSEVKIDLFFPYTSGQKISSITYPLSHHRHYFQEGLHAILYSKTPIDPPEIA